MQTPKRYTFSLVSDTDVEKSYFLCRIKIPYKHFLTFLSFINIFRSSRSQTFFKIGALKNVGTLNELKRNLQRRCFPVNTAKFLRAAFLQNFSGGCFSIIVKVIKQLFRKGYF